MKVVNSVIKEDFGPPIALSGYWTLEPAAGATPTKAEYDFMVNQVNALVEAYDALLDELRRREIIT